MALSDENDEDQVGATETYSQSSHEDEPEEEYDDDDGDDDDDLSVNDSEGDENLPLWKQHWLAIAIALIAAIAGHSYNTKNAVVVPRGKGMWSQRLFQFLEPSTAKHAHVDSYRRTANISFCPSNYMRGSPLQSLESMDFYIPQDHYEALLSFYQADESNDDYYDQQQQQLLYKDNFNVPIHDPEVACLVQQRQRPHASGKFKGSTYFYRQPTMEEIYPELASQEAVAVAVVGRNTDRNKSRQRRLQPPPLVFTGFAAKFVNLSPKPVLLYWDGKGGHDEAKKLVGEISPFESLGTATMPGHSFHVSPVFDSSTALQRWVVTADTALVYFEPEPSTQIRQMLLNNDEEPNFVAWGKYQRQLVNQAFARDYLIASKRIWLGHFPRRFPMHFMNPAEYIGQTYQRGSFSLEVISVTPRVLIIDNFLSSEDCQAIIRTSQEQGLEHSTLHSGATAKQTRDLSTRSSSNTWLPRDTNPLTERVYRQAAEIMGLDPELFQKFHESSPHHHSIAESLQVVRYKIGGEEYQPHHDFVYPSINHRYQPTRFATLLMYLNDVPQGGKTRFPRAVNNYNAQGLEITPKAGRAVLFYNMLEDGNVDDLSQHGSNPTEGYEKWLANLWVWDPIID